jgi:hypothetical protein
MTDDDKDEMTEKTLPLLAKCAVNCSESYSLGVYLEAWEGAVSVDDFLKRLSKLFPDFAGTIQDDVIRITYSRCECDLVTEGLLASPVLCRCSEMSLLYNWEAIFGKGNVSVECLETVLKGDTRCVFEVRLEGKGER